MKVSFVASADDHSAPVTVVRSLQAGLSARGVHSRVFYLAGRRSGSKISKAAVDAVRKAFIFGDVVHSHGFRPDALCFFTKAIYGHIDTPWISTLHCDVNTDLTDLHGSVAGRAFGTIWRFVRNRATGSVFLSQDLEVRYRTGGKRVVIPNGVPLKPVQKLTRDEEIEKELVMMRSGYNLLGMLSNTRPLKQIALALQAIRAEPSFALAHFGTGRELKELQALANTLGVGNRCRFFGYRPEATEYLPLLDVYLNCSVVEASPLSVLEAMRISLPVVAPRTAPFDEIFGKDSEQLYAPNDVGSLIHTVKSVISHKQDVLVRQARLFSEGYTLDKMVACHIKFYNDITRRQRSASLNSSLVM